MDGAGANIYILSMWAYYILFVQWVGSHRLCVACSWAPGYHNLFQGRI